MTAMTVRGRDAKTMIQLDMGLFPKELQEETRKLLPAAATALQEIQEKRCRGAEWTGWFDWPNQWGKDLVDRLRTCKDEIQPFYDLVLVVGIGGSYLGCRAVVDALSHRYHGSRARTTSSADPMVAFAGHHLSEAELVETLDLLEACQPLVVVISKTGTTTEPGIAFRVVRQYLERRFGDSEAAERIIAVTGQGESAGGLRKLAEDKGYKTFPVPDDVGGRFSVFTAVGLVPLALAGFDVRAFHRGADTVFREVRESGGEHPALTYASARSAIYSSGKRVEALSYSHPKLASFCEWWKQLFGESEGKDGKGLLPTGMALTTDLHSLGQYFQDGARILAETFLVVDQEGGASGDASTSGIERRLRVPEDTAKDLDQLNYLHGRLISEVDHAAMRGTQLAHADGGVPILTLVAPPLSCTTIGGLMAFFQVACGVSGALLDVNPYDQPGVEAYKKNLFALLGKPGYENLNS